VKKFNGVSSNEEVLRELATIKKFNHQNIVKLVDEKLGEKSVDLIVLEFCNGGDLFKILGRPENYNGISQTEFLLILKHFSMIFFYYFVYCFLIN
jgi:serine/threonine protein kinase